MQLQEKFGDDQVIPISLNVDFNGGGIAPAEDLQRNVVSMLTRLGIDGENVISSDPMDDVLMQFGIFSLPAVLIYDSKGDLHERFDGSVSYPKQVFPTVERLLQSRS